MVLYPPYTTGTLPSSPLIGFMVFQGFNYQHPQTLPTKDTRESLVCFPQSCRQITHQHVSLVCCCMVTLNRALLRKYAFIGKMHSSGLGFILE